MNFKEFQSLYNQISKAHNNKTHQERKEACVYAAYWEIQELIRSKTKAKEAYNRQVREINEIIKTKERNLKSLICDSDTSFDPKDFNSINPIVYT